MNQANEKDTALGKKQDGSNITGKVKGGDLISYAFWAFGGLGLDVVYLLLLDPFIFKLLFGPEYASLAAWGTVQYVIHWCAVSITWGIMTCVLIKCSKTKFLINLFEQKKKEKVWQWICAAGCTGALFVKSILSWEGFKIVKEFERQGTVRFIFQYIYYFFETGMFVLIIVFGQLAFEKWFHEGRETKIPYGGIVLALTWGMVHALTKGSLMIGLEAVLCSIVYGVIYLLLNRNLKHAYLILFLAFIL